MNLIRRLAPSTILITLRRQLIRLRASKEVLGAIGVCATIAVCTLYVTKSAAQSGNNSQPQAGSETSPIFGIAVPAGYRDWHLITVDQLAGGKSDDLALIAAHMAVRQLRAQLGNATHGAWH